MKFDLASSYNLVDMAVDPKYNPTPKQSNIMVPNTQNDDQEDYEIVGPSQKQTLSQ